MNNRTPHNQQNDESRADGENEKNLPGILDLMDAYGIPRQPVTAPTWASDSEPIHTWFSLTYANYLVLPRSVLQSMPQGWQARLCELLDEMHESFGYLDWPDYVVRCRGSHGKFVRDPIPPYNRGRTRLLAHDA